MRSILHRSCRHKQITNFVLIFFFRKSCRLWDNVGKYGRTGQTTEDHISWRVRILCWILKATNMHPCCVILTAFPQYNWFIPAKYKILVSIHFVRSFRPNTYVRVFGALSQNCRTAPISILILVRPVFSHGTTRLPLDGFSRNLMFGYFSKTRPDNSSLTKIRQE